MKHHAVRHLKKVDPVMVGIVRSIGAFDFAHEPGHPPFQALVRAIAHQQLHGAAARTILSRFIALFPGRRFPRPEDLAAVSDEKIRAAGFSRSKTAAIRDLAEKTIAGVVPTSRQIAALPDEAIIERLTSVRGIGRWTVEMLLIFKLGRPDVLPAADFGLRNGFRIAYKLDEMPSVKALLAHGEVWRPYRTAASWYLWRVADADRKSRGKTKK